MVAIKGSAEAVMPRTELVIMVLQRMQETQDTNNNHHGKGSGNSVGEALIATPCYQELSKFRKATRPLFHGDYNPVVVEK